MNRALRNAASDEYRSIGLGHDVSRERGVLAAHNTRRADEASEVASENELTSERVSLPGPISQKIVRAASIYALLGVE